MARDSRRKGGTGMSRLPSLAATAAALATVVALAACGIASDEPGSTGTGEPTATSTGDAPAESDPVDLVNMWRVTGAQGEQDPTWLRLDVNEFMLWRDCGYLRGSWKATATMFVAQTYGGTGDCSGPEEFQVDWLHAVETYRVAGDGWELLDEQQRVVATLTVDGSPDPIPNADPSFARAPAVTGSVREALRTPEPLPEGSVPAASADLLGRWVPQQATQSEPSAEFDDDGTWRGSDGCNGAAGRWMAGENGELIATGGPMTLIGCDGASVPGWVASASTAALEGDMLVLYDRDGERLGELVRD